MKAQLCRAFGPVADLEFGEVPDPVPGPGEVLFAVRRASVNFADSLIVGGRYQARPPLPFVPGSEAAGVVLAVGEDVTDFRTGDRVFGFYDQFGAFAEKMCMPAGNLEHLPDFMDFEQGAGLLAATATAHHALRQRGRLAAGETLVVLGAAGGTGTAAVQIGKAIGARVIAVCSSEEKLAFARAQGADEGINYRDEDLGAAIKHLTGGAGADVVYDTVGGDAFDACTRAMAWDGRLLVVGFASGRIPSAPANLMLVKGYAVVGVFWGTFAAREPAAHRANMDELFAWIEQGRVRPVVDTVYPLADAVSALDHVAGRGAIGKVLLAT